MQKKWFRILWISSESSLLSKSKAKSKKPLSFLWAHIFPGFSSDDASSLLLCWTFLRLRRQTSKFGCSLIASESWNAFLPSITFHVEPRETKRNDVNRTFILRVVQHSGVEIRAIEQTRILDNLVAWCVLIELGQLSWAEELRKHVCALAWRRVRHQQC